MFLCFFKNLLVMVFQGSGMKKFFLQWMYSMQVLILNFDHKTSWYWSCKHSGRFTKHLVFILRHLSCTAFYQWLLIFFLISITVKVNEWYIRAFLPLNNKATFHCTLAALVAGIFQDLSMGSEFQLYLGEETKIFKSFLHSPYSAQRFNRPVDRIGQ